MVLITAGMGRRRRVGDAGDLVPEVAGHVDG
jgi:hypothetical protein